MTSSARGSLSVVGLILLLGVVPDPAVAFQTAAASQLSPPRVPLSGSPAEQRVGGPGRGDAQPWLWWRDESVKKELGLKLQQVRNLDNLWATTLQKTTGYLDDLRRLEAELDRLINDPSADRATVSVKVEQAETLRTLRNKARLMMLFDMHHELTTEQNLKLKEISARRQSGRGRS